MVLGQATGSTGSSLLWEHFDWLSVIVHLLFSLSPNIRIWADEHWQANLATILRHSAAPCPLTFPSQLFLLPPLIPLGDSVWESFSVTGE